MDDGAFQDIGERLTRALLAGDFALYRDLFVLPVTLTPREGAPYVIADLDALREDFDLYHMVLRTNAVTDIFRDLQDVTPTAPGAVVVRVITHIMEHANRVAEPFETRFFLSDHGGDWRINAIESAPSHLRWSRGQAGHGFGWV
ncbi:MAG: hypothetical protein ACT4N9_09215 [Paracoccaceae bacterium]